MAVDGTELELTRTEFHILHALVNSGKQVRTKSDSMHRLRGDEYDVGTLISDAAEGSPEVRFGSLGAVGPFLEA